MKKQNLVVRPKLRVLRAAHRISQTDLAKRLGISRQAVSNIENDVTVSMSFEMMADLMLFFRLDSFDDLFELIDPEENRLGNKIPSENVA